MRRRCYINISGGRDRYGTGGGGRRGIYHISGGRDPDCRAECEDGATIYICAILQMIETEWLCVIYVCVCAYVCVCDTKGMLDTLLYMVAETSDTGHVCIYQHQLNSN